MDSVHYALQHGDVTTAARIMHHVDEDVLTSAVLSGDIRTIRFVMDRWPEGARLDYRMIFVACAKADVHEDVWEYCTTHCPYLNFNAALKCALKFHSHNAIEYLVRMYEFSPEAKLWCQNLEQLKMIHAKNDSWPMDFLCEIENHEMREYYKSTESKRKLAEVFGIIEELDIPEGDYLKVCKIMKELHAAL